LPVAKSRDTAEDATATDTGLENACAPVPMTCAVNVADEENV
jgi:hypothetical protein